MYGDNVHQTTNAQIATSPLVILGEESVLSVWDMSGCDSAPTLDADPTQVYTAGTGGIAVIDAGTGALLASMAVRNTSKNTLNVPFTLDLSAHAGKSVYIEVVDAFAGSYGWILIDQITITNAAEGSGQLIYDSPMNGATNIPLALDDSGNDLIFTVLDPNMTHADVFLSLSEPNRWDDTPIVEKMEANSDDPNTYPINLSTYTLPAELLDSGHLRYNTTYYWQVVGYKDVGGGVYEDSSVGAVWRFTTVPEYICNTESEDYIALEPFDYNDDCQVNFEDFAMFATVWLEDTRDFTNP